MRAPLPINVQDHHRILNYQVVDRCGTATNEKVLIATLTDMAIEPIVLVGKLIPES
jgi:hypothetical protein